MVYLESIFIGILSAGITAIIIHKLDLKKLEKLKKFELKLDSYLKIIEIVEGRSKRYFYVIKEILKGKKEKLKEIEKCLIDEDKNFPWQHFSFFRKIQTLNAMKEFLDIEQEINKESKSKKNFEEIKTSLKNMIQKLIEKKTDLIDSLKEELKI